MNKTIENQLHHTTIRKFNDEKIDKEIMNTLFDVAIRSASSNGMYSYSMIHVTDDDKKEQISKICNQPYVKSTSDLIIFVVDIYRNSMIAKENHIDDIKKDMDVFFQGVSDSLISAQNMVIAAESLSIGTVYFGSILNDVDKMRHILKLPKLTFPIIGLGLGYKAHEPALKPRLPKFMQVFENEYKTFDNYTDTLREFDEEMNKYIDLRDTSKSVGKFSKQIQNKMKSNSDNARNFIDEIKKCGFDIGLV